MFRLLVEKVMSRYDRKQQTSNKTAETRAIAHEPPTKFQNEKLLINLELALVLQTSLPNTNEQL